MTFTRISINQPVQRNVTRDFDHCASALVTCITRCLRLSLVFVSKSSSSWDVQEVCARLCKLRSSTSTTLTVWLIFWRIKTTDILGFFRSFLGSKTLGCFPPKKSFSLKLEGHKSSNKKFPETARISSGLYATKGSSRVLWRWNCRRCTRWEVLVNGFYSMERISGNFKEETKQGC